MQFQPPTRHACVLSHLLSTNHFFGNQLCLSYCSSPNLTSAIQCRIIALQRCLHADEFITCNAVGCLYMYVACTSRNQISSVHAGFPLIACIFSEYCIHWVATSMPPMSVPVMLQINSLCQTCLNECIWMHIQEPNSTHAAYNLHPPGIRV